MSLSVMGAVLVQLAKGKLGVIFLRHTRKPDPDCWICCPWIDLRLLGVIYVCRT